jgi:hypothetical protein
MSHDICTSGRNETRLSKTKVAARTLSSCHNLHLRLQAIKLHGSLTYPLKIVKGQSTPYPRTHDDLLIIDIRHCVGLNMCCGWHLRLKHLELLLESGDHHYPHLKLKVLLLYGVL